MCKQTGVWVISTELFDQETAALPSLLCPERQLFRTMSSTESVRSSPNLPNIALNRVLTLGLCDDSYFVSEMHQRWSRLCIFADQSCKKQYSAEAENTTSFRQSRHHKGLSIIQAKAESALAVQDLLAAKCFKVQ